MEGLSFYLFERPRVLAAKAFTRGKKTLCAGRVELGVPVEVILAIIGVETYFGKNKGVFEPLMHWRL